MNLDYLETFRELVRLGSFSAVAKYLSISQPAVSFQIQKMEADLGTTLIDRSQKKLKLTDSGHRVLEFALNVHKEHATLKSDLDKLRTDIVGELKLATSTIPGEFLVPPLLGEFMSFHPDTTAHVDIMDSITVIDSVKYGDYKLGFCGTTPPEKDGMSSFKIASDEIILIASSSHPLARAASVDFARLKNESFIGREVTSGTRQSLEQALHSRSISLSSLQFRLILSNTHSVISAVEAGSGLAFVSSLGAQKSLMLGTVRKLNVAGLNIKRDFYCIYYSSGEDLRLVEEFLSFVKHKSSSPDWYMSRPAP